ncbi:MAG: hypothetical protein ACE5ET_05655 [Gammaproteobacteria bacterium]
MSAHLILLAAVLVLGGCGGGASTETLPSRDISTQGVSYSGPAPATSDVQNFKLNVWDNLSAGNRCGACHGQDGSCAAMTSTSPMAPSIPW